MPDFQTLMLPVLRVAAESEVRISDVVDRLAIEFALSPEERSHLLPSGTQTTFSNRVHWAKSYLGKAGLIEAHFRITDRGREVLDAFTSSAHAIAEQLSKRIVLVDGEHLTPLMIRHSVGCRVEETLYIKKLDEEFFRVTSRFTRDRAVEC